MKKVEKEVDFVIRVGTQTELNNNFTKPTVTKWCEPQDYNLNLRRSVYFVESPISCTSRGESSD